MHHPRPQAGPYRRQAESFSGTTHESQFTICKCCLASTECPKAPGSAFLSLYMKQSCHPHLLNVLSVSGCQESDEASNPCLLGLLQEPQHSSLRKRAPGTHTAVPLSLHLHSHRWATLHPTPGISMLHRKLFIAQVPKLEHLGKQFWSKMSFFPSEQMSKYREEIINRNCLATFHRKYLFLDRPL